MNKNEQTGMKGVKIGNGVCGAAGEAGHIHVKKEKAGKGVCGAAGKAGHCTRQKEKNKK